MTQFPQCPKLPANLLRNCTVLPDRDDILPLLPKGKVFVEVGVLLGDFSAKILQICEPRYFVGMDIFRVHELPSIWGRPAREIFGERTHGEFYRERFSVPIEQGRMKVVENDSAVALSEFQDKSIDIVYIDADHTYEAVRKDLAAVKTKMSDDGIIILNDYTMVDILGEMGAYGIIQATHEFMLDEGWEMIYLALHSYMYCDVALRKLK